MHTCALIHPEIRHLHQYMQQNLSVQDETFSPSAHHQKKVEGQRETLRVHLPEMDGRGEGGENGGVSEERSGQYEAMRCVIGA